MKIPILVRAGGSGAIAALLLTLAAFAATSAPPARFVAQRRPAPAATQPPLGVNLLGQRGGLAVQSVAAGSLAEQAGIQRGDVITHLNTRPVPSLEVFTTLVKNRSASEPLELTLSRGRATVQVTFPPAGAAAPGGRDQQAIVAAARRDIRSTRMRAAGVSPGPATPVEVADPFQIPGLAAASPPAPASTSSSASTSIPAAGSLPSPASMIRPLRPARSTTRRCCMMRCAAPPRSSASSPRPRPSPPLLVSSGR